MRRVLLLAALLLTPSIAVAEPDPVRPVQVILDAIPEVANLTVQEASQDLTPDDALLLLDVMRAYVANFTQSTHWPDGSSADDPDVRAAFAKAVQVTDIMGRVPDHLAAVEEARAACASTYNGTAVSQNDVRAWIQAWAGGVLQVQSAANLLDHLLDGTSLPLDAEPLHQAADTLRQWRASNGDTALECIVTVAQEVGVEVPDDILLVQVTPSEAYPTQEVEVYGAVFGGSQQVTIQIDGVGALSTFVEGGAFQTNLTLPLRTDFGDHDVHAYSGDASGDTVLTVVQAPSEIVIDAPSSITVGQDLTVRFQVHAPIANVIGSGPLTITGAEDRELSLQDDAAAATFRDLPVGDHEFQVQYPGSYWVDASEATFTVIVREAAASPSPPNTISGPETDLAFPAFGIGLWSIWPIWVVPLLVAGLLVGLRLLRRTRWTRLIPSPRQRFRLIPEISLAGQGVVRLFARVHATLVRLGFIRPGTTPRESLAFFQARSVDAEATVTAFERTRYGGHPEDPAQEADTTSWAQKVWSMFRRDG